MEVSCDLGRFEAKVLAGTFRGGRVLSLIVGQLEILALVYSFHEIGEFRKLCFHCPSPDAFEAEAGCRSFNLITISCYLAQYLTPYLVSCTLCP